MTKPLNMSDMFGVGNDDFEVKMMSALRNGKFNQPIHEGDSEENKLICHAVKNYDALAFVVEKLRKENEMLKKTRGMQPVLFVDGVIRFKKNRIVDDILSHSREHGFGLNQIALGDYSDEEHAQLAQLIGYSVSGFGGLDYVSESMFEIAHEMAAEISK